MSRILITVALLALAACPDRKPAVAVEDAGASPAARPTPPVVSVTLAPVAVGTRWQLEHHSALTFSTIAGTDGSVQPVDGRADELVRYTVEVLAADGPEPTKVKMAFDEARRQAETAVDAGVHPLAGKGFLVEWRPASMVVTLTDGGAVTALEGTLIRVYADLVRPNEVQLALARVPQPAGDAPELAKAFATMYARREGFKGGPRAQISNVAATLQDRAETVEVQVTLEVKASDRTMTIFTVPKVTMELVKATGIVRSMRLDGAVEMSEPTRTSSGRVVETTTWK